MKERRRRRREGGKRKNINGTKGIDTRVGKDRNVKGINKKRLKKRKGSS